MSEDIIYTSEDLKGELEEQFNNIRELDHNDYIAIAAFIERLKNKYEK